MHFCQESFLEAWGRFPTRSNNFATIWRQSKHIIRKKTDPIIVINLNLWIHPLPLISSLSGLIVPLCAEFAPSQITKCTTLINQVLTRYHIVLSSWITNDPSFFPQPDGGGDFLTIIMTLEIQTIYYTSLSAMVTRDYCCISSFMYDTEKKWSKMRATLTTRSPTTYLFFFVRPKLTSSLLLLICSIIYQHLLSHIQLKSTIVNTPDKKNATTQFVLWIFFRRWDELTYYMSCSAGYWHCKIVTNNVVIWYDVKWWHWGCLVVLLGVGVVGVVLVFLLVLS